MSELTKKNVTYRTYLSREFESRKRRNSQYSLRAFARDLNMQPSKLSEILNSRCGLSTEAALDIAKKIRLTELETEYFINLVEAEHSRSEFRKAQAQERLKSFQAVHGYSELDLERFMIISDWQHFAILELTDLHEFQSNAKWIAKRLDISEQVAQESIQRLLDFGLLKTLENGTLQQTHEHLATPSGIPSREIREHHAQILQKANESIDKFGVTERDLSSMMMGIAEDQLEEAKQELKEFRRAFAKKYQAKKPKDRVYCLSMQLFPLDQKEET